MMSITIDIWCNPDAKDVPEQIGFPLFDPIEKDTDPCNIVLEMEHANACPAVDLQLYLYMLGIFFFFSGYCL